ncbi:S8 family serine peptidase [Paenibacillus rhizovicinus]|uniref:S8 family serine peptidase n=1 Tax=Paenibacillus rhizovicinus TaxID=2704463 RepID=A0A6C0NTF8_9BACL|nr:S8 family serine peptidase [Paenibacillus rhizovicinus]QHW29499.1 S8 family serine peptidase [Paenibacillus rhizovicinus]
MYAEPSWFRLGFSEVPGQSAGQGIGIIIIDDICPHPTLNHLADRIKHVVVANDNAITCSDIVNEGFNPSNLDNGIHGLMTVLTLAHEPFTVDGFCHAGIAPAGNFVVLSHGAFKDGEGERLKLGIDWILSNLPDLNIRIILSLGWHAQDNTVLLERTKSNSTVQSLAAAVERGVLVICANGNSDIGNILPPLDYLAVGGFDDRGKADRIYHTPYPGEPHGFNGDGHYRPDIRAPRTRVIVPYCEGEPRAGQLSVYTGTSAASTLVAGVCMYLLSSFPFINNYTLRNALVRFGDKLVEDKNYSPCVNVKKTIEALLQGYISEQKIESQLVDDTGIAARAVNLSRAIRKKEYTRGELWEYSNDPNSLIRKIAVHSLGWPVDRIEREIYWDRFDMEPEDGVRTWYLYGLLQHAEKEELTRWIPLAASPHWSIRWCVGEFLGKFSDLPQFVKTHEPELVPQYAHSLFESLE